MVEGKDVFKDVAVLDIQGQMPGEITGLTCDSRQVQAGDLFIALRGARYDGHDYIPEIAKKNACAAVVETFSQDSVPQIRVNDTLAALPRLAANYFNHPAKALNAIGITGSNGKTTSAYLMESILKAAGYNPAVLGTIEYRYQDQRITAETTTPLPHVLQKLLRDVVDTGCSHVVMEVSSHGLTLHRVDEVAFHTALFTNLSQDHLDFHQTMDEYRNAKMRLFTHHLHPEGTAIFNVDDETGASFTRELNISKTLTFAIDNQADFKASAINLSLDGTRFICTTPDGPLTIESKLIGRHNIQNMLGVIACAWAGGINLKHIQQGLNQFEAVPGRLETIENSIGAQVVVDYCHTPDALEKCLQTLSALPHQRLITVFGCGGDRDKGKRPQMGRIAQKYSDYVIVTNDNPRTEDPAQILHDIEQGMNTQSGPYDLIANRDEAIKTAIEELQAQDILLIAGKGHEDYQIIGHTKHHFDDRERARHWLTYFEKGEQA